MTPDAIANWLDAANPQRIPWIWIVIGFTAQALFSTRFIVQWIASERRGRSVLPAAFWWLSLVGGALLLAYAIRRADPVFVVGQAAGLIVYARNLVLLRRPVTDVASG